MGDAWDMATQHQGLIKAYLTKNQWIIDKSHTLDYSDYWQIGILAIHHAAEKFDPRKGKFSSYAYLWIRQHITRAFKNQAFPVMRIPVNRHPPTKISTSAMNKDQLWAHNALNQRIDLSCVDFIGNVEIEEPCSEMFKFFD